MKRALMAVSAVLVLGIVWLFYVNGGGATPSGQAPLQRMQNGGMNDIRNRFNATAEPKVLMLLSPT